MARSHYNRSSRFFTPFVGWFYLGYTSKATKSETLYLKYKYKKKRNKIPIFQLFPTLSKKNHLFLELISVSTTSTIVRPIATAVIQWVHIFAQVTVIIV